MIRLFLVVTILFLIVVNCQSQSLPALYKIDGSISFLEYSDTLYLKKVFSSDHFTIKENDSLFYLAIQSNTSTIANAYIKTKNKLQIMHASAALGEMIYELKLNIWKKEQEFWEWRYRDLIYWKELHPRPLQDQLKFFKVFGWFASSISKGSFREWEFIISKQLLKNIRDLGVTFYIKKNQKFELMNEPYWFYGLSNNSKLNRKIHMGELPKMISKELLEP